MAFKASVGYASGEDAYVTGANACQEALDKLGDTRADLALVFASVQYDQDKMLAGVVSVVKDAQVVGASSSGEITTDGPLSKHSIAVMLYRSDDVQFYTGIGEHIATNAREAGKTAADNVKKLATGDLKAFMMLPDPLAGNGADIVRGVADSLGEHFPIVGGAAGDDFKFEKTYQYYNGKAYTGAVVGIGFTGAFTMGIGVKHGWIPIGAPTKVTKSEGGVLHELDGKPAIAIYEDYFGPEEAGRLKTERLATLAVTYPLGMRIEGSDEMLIRDPLWANADGSITCAAEIPEGAEIQLMIGNRDEAIVQARAAAQNALSQMDSSKPKAIVIFNCIARRKLFGDDAGKEIKAIQEVLGSDVPLIGFYTYGEQAPINGEVRNIAKCNPAFHNETVVICALGD